METPPNDWDNSFLDPNTRKQIDWAQAKWDACVGALEEIKGRIFRNDQMKNMLSIERLPDGSEFIRLEGKPSPILKFEIVDNSLIVTKYYIS